IRAHVERVSFVGPFTPTQPRSVLIVTMESTRYDALERALDGRHVMPRLRAEIDDGALSVPHAYATRGFTTTSLGNLFWGTYYDPGSSLFDDVRDSGWEIAAFSGYDLAIEGVELSAGLRRSEVRFDPRDDDSLVPPRDTSPARNVASAIESWLMSRDTERPFLGYVHLQDPHFPYDQDNPDVFSDGPLPSGRIEADNAGEV